VEFFVGSLMKYLIASVLVAFGCQASADCSTSLPLEGVTSIKVCDPRTETCISGSQAVYEYMNKVEDDPAVLTIGLQASPWRFYDGEMRVLTVEEVAEMARSHIKDGVKRVALLASWTGVAPGPRSQSLAQRLSGELKGFPVSGMDGFLWISKNGAMHTTRQAFSVTQGGRPYGIVDGEDVMVAFAAGWPATMEDTFVSDRNADGVMQAAAGWDIFFLCPDRALEAFDLAAKLSNPVAAYNAALIRLERGSHDDMQTAATLLTQAADAGDMKARARLVKLQREGR
jgi:hypothetical protein